MIARSSLLIVLALFASPAAAVDLGNTVGGALGGVSGGVEGKAGHDGGSLGAGASAGGASVGVDVGIGGGGVGTGGGAGGAPLGGGLDAAVSGAPPSASGSIDVGAGAAGRSGATSGGSGRAKEGVAAGQTGLRGKAVAEDESPLADAVIRLPWRLRPTEPGGGGQTSRPIDVTGSLQTLGLAPLAGRPGAPPALLGACRAALAQAAAPYRPLRVEVAAAGARQSRATAFDARIVYERRGRLEVKQSRVQCRVDAAGRVLDLG